MNDRNKSALMRSAWARWLKLHEPRAFILRVTYRGKQREFAVVCETRKEGGVLVVYDHAGVPAATSHAQF